MLRKKTALFAASVGLALLASTANANAASFTSVIVYGDSLSDNGNLYGATGQPPFPYYLGRFSNGPVAVEQLAADLGAPLYDFAWGGATTGVGNIGDGGTQTTPGVIGLPGMEVELAGSEAAIAPLLPSSLVVVWGGANDFEAGGSPITAANNVDALVATLEADGATHILVPGLPDLGLTPEFYNDPVALAYSVAFNNALLARLPGDATYVNVFSLMDQIVANPSAYGFTNVTTPCFNGASVCANPSSYLFWDDIHPTTAADTILAQGFASAVPEPSSILMLGTGLAGLWGAFRKRRAA